MAGSRTCFCCGCTDDDCRGCVERSGEPCSWVDTDLCSACASVSLPAVITSDIAEALAYPNFQTGPLSDLYRRGGGFTIRRRMEDEQAFVLWRFVRLAVVHGPAWRKFAKEDLRRMGEGAKAS